MKISPITLTEKLDKHIENFYDSLAGHPKLGLLIIIVILAVFLAGIILGWKWTYARGSFWSNILLNLFPEPLYRVVLGIFVAAIILVCLGLMFLY